MAKTVGWCGPCTASRDAGDLATGTMVQGPWHIVPRNNRTHEERHCRIVDRGKRTLTRR